ncbi:MAG TPA: hypothetical protein VNA25_26390 [Phycisphaerae bacterium]|nr:hypothetical protein [Phycisphaerae bacterium]
MLVPTQKRPGDPIVMMDDSLLVKKTGFSENDNEIATWVEYWLSGELVHRSAHVHLKKNIFADAVVSGF